MVSVKPFISHPVVRELKLSKNIVRNFKLVENPKNVRSQITVVEHVIGDLHRDAILRPIDEVMKAQLKVAARVVFHERAGVDRQKWEVRRRAGFPPI
ncbi:hypothetical protein BJF93_20455 [Xaviernesmea oryzae]|uniref:Uncharacterized protein n=1 Tax=Xaviernesmea oryzae TaxID=464029 RepID=A0A1Q9AVW4_9HYPH|nr:hypothetical protein BJF93_20455 [Xaviernesmea oryzae]